MKKVIFFLKSSILVAFFITILFFVNNKMSEQYISLQSINIQPSDVSFINEKMILEYMLDGQIIFDSCLVKNYELKTLEALLDSHINIKNAEVFMDLKGKLSIDIFQRVPLVRIITKDKSYYLDDIANVMSTSSFYTPRVLVVTGDIEEKNHLEIFNFINTINKNDFWKSQFTQIHYQNNEYILVPSVGNHKIYFGLLEDVNQKLDNLYHFYREVLPAKGWQTYSNINLKYQNQIVCTKN